MLNTMQGFRGGTPGPKGDTGDKGDIGVTSERGLPGNKGERGDPGLTGSKGDRVSTLYLPKFKTRFFNQMHIYTAIPSSIIIKNSIFWTLVTLNPTIFLNFD